MPELCRWGKVIIRIRIDDHAWPHVHVKYAEYEASLRLRDLAITHGDLPANQKRQVLEWAQDRQADLIEAWARMERHEPVVKISPLD